MSTNPVYFFAHEKTKTYVRAHLMALQVIRNHELIASYDYHFNYQVAAAKNGLVSFYRKGGQLSAIDLAAEHPQEVRKIGKGKIVHPGGEHVVQCDSGAIKLINIQSGTIDEIWPFDSANPKAIEPFGQEADENIPDYKRKALPTGMISNDSFEFVLDEDGEFWAFVTTNRIVFGRQKEQLASLCWQYHWFFYPQTCTFDKENECLYLAGSPGVISIGFDGSLRGFWQGKEEPVSPALVYGDKVVLVLQQKSKNYSDPKLFMLHKFHRSSLAHEGPSSEFPPFRDSDSWFGLAKLADGSLVVAPRQQVLRLLPAESGQYKTTEQVVVIGNEAGAKFPHLDDGENYDRTVGETGVLGCELAESTKAQRNALARFILEESISDSRFTSLFFSYPGAFAAWRDYVVNLSQAEILRLRQIDRTHWYRAFLGASEKTANKLRERVDDILGQEQLSANDKDVAIAITKIFIGMNTPRALLHLAELARKHTFIGTTCFNYHIEVPEEGAAIARYCPQQLSFMKERIYQGEPKIDPSLKMFQPMSELLSEPYGLDCAKPLVHLLSVPLSKLPGNPIASSKAKNQHFFVANCEECDEALAKEYRFCFDEVSKKLTLERGSEEPSCSCQDDEAYDDEGKHSYHLARHKEDYSFEVIGYLGGVAPWWQYPEPPFCCGRLMFYVGYLAASSVRDDVPDIGIYAFHCEDCFKSTQVMQMT